VGSDEAPITDPSAAAERVNEAADRYYVYMETRRPEVFYEMGVELDRHDGLFDNTPSGYEDDEKEQDAIYLMVQQIDPTVLIGQPEWITYGYLRQELDGTIRMRVCRNELWSVNQMWGWQLNYAQIAQLQPVGTSELREQALVRWNKFPDFVDQETVNLERGLARGYSAPKSVVNRVIEQLDGLLALEVEESPFFSAAQRDDDEDFRTALRELVSGRINLAIQRYRDYLAATYLGQAREALSVRANPDGDKCYRASLYYYTTLDRSPREVFELGERTVAANRAGVVELGEIAYGLDDFAAIIAKAKSDASNRFRNKEELLEFARAKVRLAQDEMPNWVGLMPTQPIEVVPFLEHEEGTGRSAHYIAGNDDRPGEYRIPLHQPEEQSRGRVETTAFHETWPGHHLQVATAQKIEGLHPISRVIWFSGPGEGWARYSESLAEEMGLYNTTTGPILRRVWPARGMVVDPGIHMFDWTREQAVEFMRESGRHPSEEQLHTTVDRIAILPGQLTAYDSGGLEILALRAEVKKAFGDEFDIREFHDRVLENGPIPLSMLRQQVEAWIESKM
jgi:uncharacterized protein (DUF885 family)